MNAGKLIAQGTPQEIAGSMKEGMVLCVSFKGTLEESTSRSLGSLAGVRAVAAVRRLSDDRVDVDLDVEPGADPSEAVYDWAVAHGRKILGMRVEKASLEDLFARLTGGGRDE
jgi:ABC-type multidrug transport system ATPase subunit